MAALFTCCLVMMKEIQEGTRLKGLMKTKYDDAEKRSLSEGK
jgi:hypothetical protein|tara:strand:+ start:2306 stop:2431 length:126 start_codon:yes stop_codon:yes gene_type:complete